MNDLDDVAVVLNSEREEALARELLDLSIVDVIIIIVVLWVVLIIIVLHAVVSTFILHVRIVFQIRS